MRIRAAAIGILILGLVLTASAQRAAVLLDVTTVQVEPTVIPDPDKVKEDFAASLVTDSLINALKESNLQVGESSVRAHIVLEEFSSGSTAKRLLVGLGAGRSVVDGRLIFTDASGRELANVGIRVRGNLLFSSYQGGNTQRRQATNAFEQKLTEEIARLKPVGSKGTKPTVASTVTPATPAPQPATTQLAPATAQPAAPAAPAPASTSTTSSPSPAPVLAAVPPPPPPPKFADAPKAAPVETSKAAEAPKAATDDAAAARTALDAGARAEAARDWPTALQQYERARGLDPTMATFINLAIARVREQMSGSNSSASSGSDALRRAKQYDALGRRSEAITWYEKALEAMPQSDPNRDVVTKRLSELTGK
jgi:hypothetical protein